MFKDQIDFIQCQITTPSTETRFVKRKTRRGTRKAKHDEARETKTQKFTPTHKERKAGPGRQDDARHEKKKKKRTKNTPHKTKKKAN
jgi:hypothetical protein